MPTNPPAMAPIDATIVQQMIAANQALLAQLQNDNATLRQELTDTRKEVAKLNLKFSSNQQYVRTYTRFLCGIQIR